MLDPAALAKIKSLELRAKVVVEGFWSGIHRSPLHGFSVEFSEYRQYSVGDDPRFIDWRVYARSDRYFIKKFEDETNLRCQLVVDQSRSMTYGTGPMTKAEYAATLAATFAYFLHGQGDAVGAATFADELRDYLPPRHRPGHLRRLMILLEQPAAGTGTSLGEPLRKVAEIQRRRGLFVLVSDLLAPLDDVAARLGYLRARGHEVEVIQVLDRRELDFRFDVAVPFRDLESGRQVYIDPAAARGGYLEKLGTHLEAVAKICAGQGIGYHLMVSDEPVEVALHRYLGARAAPTGAEASRRKNPVSPR